MLVDNVEVSTSGGSTGGNPTPTPTPPTPPTTGDFTQTASSLGANQAQFTFQPNGWSAGYAILHYKVGNGDQQNVNMTYNSGASRWEYTAGGLNPGNVLNYSFTYQKNGLQYDSGGYSYTFGAAPPPPPNGGFAQGVNSTASNQAQFTFQPGGWSAGYVIAHYKVGGGDQQNVNMTYNGGASRWEYTAGGISSGNAVSYSFTYQKNGLQYDTDWYSWTHP